MADALRGSLLTALLAAAVGALMAFWALSNVAAGNWLWGALATGAAIIMLSGAVLHASDYVQSRKPGA